VITNCPDTDEAQFSMLVVPCVKVVLEISDILEIDVSRLGSKQNVVSPAH